VLARPRTENQDLHWRVNCLTDREFCWSRRFVQVGAANPDYFVDVAACCALESAPACASLAYSPLFERFGRGTVGR
jgi:hypothetical protein